MKKIIIEWENGKIKFDLKKQKISIFELIHILGKVISNLSDIGYKEEEKK